MRTQRAFRMFAPILVLTLLASCDLLSALTGGAATLGVSPTSVDLGAVATGDSNTGNVTVENFSAGASSVSASVDRSWLSVSDASFSMPAGGTDALTIQGTCSPALEGTVAKGNVTLSDGSTSVQVQVQISCFPPTDLAASPPTAYLSGEGRETPSFEVLIGNTTDNPITFTVQDLPTWLGVTPSSSSIPGHGTVSLALTSTAACQATRRIVDGSFNLDFSTGPLVVDAFEICSNSPAHDYNVDIRFFGDGFDLDSITAFLDAAERWEAVITDDVEDRSGLDTDAGDCSGPGFPNEPGLDNVTVDDLLIHAGLFTDEPFGVVGSAGPCIVRSSRSPDPLIPVYGTAFFDSADVSRLQTEGRFDAVILHEMGHVIGVGTIWDNLELTEFSGSGADCVSSTDLTEVRYTGVYGVGAYETLTGNAETSVPAEEDGGPGTRCGHWDEEVFGNELMTGTLDHADDPLSALTGESLIDLGYATDDTAYDASYDLPACSPLCLTDAEDEEDHGTEILQFPRYTIAPDGTLEPL